MVSNKTLEPKETSNVDAVSNRFSRPIYRGPRSFTTFEKNSNLERCTPLQPLPKELKTEEIKTSISNQPLYFEKTGLHRQFHESHPNVEIPDLRASRNNRKLFYEKRHFIPEANGAKSFDIR